MFKLVPLVRNHIISEAIEILLLQEEEEERCKEIIDLTGAWLQKHMQLNDYTHVPPTKHDRMHSTKYKHVVHTSQAYGYHPGARDDLDKVRYHLITVFIGSTSLKHCCNRVTGT